MILTVKNCYVEFPDKDGFKHMYKMLTSDSLRDGEKQYIFKNPNYGKLANNPQQFRDKNLYQLKVRNNKLIKSDNITFSAPKKVSDTKYRRYFDLKLKLNLAEFISHNSGKDKPSLNVENKASVIQFDRLTAQEKREWQKRYIQTIKKEVWFWFKVAKSDNDDLNYNIDWENIELI